MLECGIATCLTRAGWACFALTAMFFLTACGEGGGGLSDYDRMQLEKTQAADALRAKGITLEEKQYTMGKAWSVNLSGQQVDDETFENLKKVGYISELNLSGSTLTDAHAPQLNAEQIRGVLIKLDISKTEFSDAGLAQLKDLNLLMELDVTGSKVTKAGIDKFLQERIGSASVLEMFKRPKVKI